MTTINLSRRSKFGLLPCVAAILMFLAPQARADEDRDPPKRVARISVVDGSVSLQPGGQGDWGAAASNRPMTIGDKIWVDKDSRAELQTGQAAFHLGSMTAFSFLNLDEGITQVRVAEGSLNFRVRELRQGDLYEIDTPNLAFTVKEAGAFRIDVSESGDSSRVSVIRGFGEVSAGGQNYDIHAGEQAEFEGAENPTYKIGRAPGSDGLDRWAEERDLREDRSASGNYVSRDMPGYDDLDENGSWRDEPEYGHVWYPSNMPPDWAPYGYGNWNWVDPWGWSWVGYEPWGFAPYHYGRWAYIGGAWGWCPGSFYGPPCYGPAFVGFFGGGWGFGVGFGVGWFPLGWGEPFFPWFHCSRGFVNVINVHNTYIRNVNVLNNTNVHNINFVNSHNVRAVTTASRNSFTNGERINRGNQHITASQLNNAKVTNSVGIRPVQHSTLGSANFHSGVHQPPATVQTRAVVARTTPAPAASHTPVRTMNNGGMNAGRSGNAQVNSSASANAHSGNASVNGSARANSGFENRPGSAQANPGTSARQRELSQNRPPSATNGSNHSTNGPAGNSPRSWEAQGNTTDRGRAPQGFGSSNRPSNAPAQNAPRTMNDRPQGFGGSNHPANAPAQNSARNYSDRPPWAGSGAQPGGGNNSPSRPSAPNSSSNRPNYSNGGRSYEPPQRSTPPSGNRGYAQQPSYSPPRSSSPRTYSAPSRSYPAPSRSYSAPSAPRSYSPPSRSYSAPSYSAPSRSYSPPSRSYGTGGGSYAYHGGGGNSGGGAYHGGGGSSGGGSHSAGGGGGHSSGGGGSHGGGGGHPHR